MRGPLIAIALAAGGWRSYRLLASGAVTIDVGVGRRLRELGPLTWEISAPRDVVFDVIASPYLERAPRALDDKLQVWERSPGMVLAAHFTRVRGATATTVETVQLARPGRVDFRLVRGPVPHVRESFVLDETGAGTSLTWSGALGTDFWAPGAWWGGRVAHYWEQAVCSSLQAIIAEAERRARTRLRRS